MYACIYIYVCLNVYEIGGSSSFTRVALDHTWCIVPIWFEGLTTTGPRFTITAKGPDVSWSSPRIPTTLHDMFFLWAFGFVKVGYLQKVQHVPHFPH